VPVAHALTVGAVLKPVEPAAVFCVMAGTAVLKTAK
jgi:hypothetical protein